MKRVLLILATCSFGVSTIAYDRGEKPTAVSERVQADSNSKNKKESMSKNILITVGNASFIVTLEDNDAAKAFMALLPLKVKMLEMNGNEKYYNLPEKLPTAGYRPGKIHSGDLMLWGANTLVLFYETFSSSYSYTRLGRVNDPKGLARALGGGNVTVSFNVQ